MGHLNNFYSIDLFLLSKILQESNGSKLFIESKIVERCSRSHINAPRHALDFAGVGDGAGAHGGCGCAARLAAFKSDDAKFKQRKKFTALQSQRIQLGRILNAL